ncbi:hypothetical protein FRUB_08456 [Fimbriiglobus ruber]|uniref:Uncharacterized protein n=1 Tax=Fimbriiglobus ruber TaxID=1908690 RepID=A0A225D4M5_9BACT|nr:hypothetical protein FRUB_08456 [Fimbriiglobus ruber]
MRIEQLLGNHEHVRAAGIRLDPSPGVRSHRRNRNDRGANGRPLANEFRAVQPNKADRNQNNRQDNSPGDSTAGNGKQRHVATHGCVGRGPGAGSTVSNNLLSEQPRCQRRNTAELRPFLRLVAEKGSPRSRGVLTAGRGAFKVSACRPITTLRIAEVPHFFGESPVKCKQTDRAIPNKTLEAKTLCEKAVRKSTPTRPGDFASGACWRSVRRSTGRASPCVDLETIRPSEKMKRLSGIDRAYTPGGE